MKQLQGVSPPLPLFSPQFSLNHPKNRERKENAMRIEEGGYDISYCLELEIKWQIFSLLLALSTYRFILISFYNSSPETKFTDSSRFRKTQATIHI
ncbi:hypothetical protein L1987_26178 [Smallanthus sonchifolius]|uniref:Uncharacterized protein n=1 Tax=Smallanthus sonchifolius TaxID=185202 RepID=A0ACB9I8J7_9ASTR|nr:hypothetical protein L1987_26178 [Smallanthus sonchifolius]